VIDWTTLQVSDPRADLAWTLVLQKTHVGLELYNYVLREYERLAGARIEQLAWFETLACLWRLSDVVVVLSGGADELGMHAEAASMIKQNLGPIKLVYEMLLERINIRVTEVERLFVL
jgi:aminoglycoside phosphotransferase (APT) family kinase protein